MFTNFKETLKSVPVIGKSLVNIKRRLNLNGTFKGSATYWEDRYATGGNSGSGSYNRLAEFKADIINQFLVEHDVTSAIEFGCGDGNQLGMIAYKEYIGLDVSKTAIKACASRYALDNSKSFFLYDAETFIDKRRIFQADVSLSLDVIYHLIEQHVYEKYMNDLMNASTRFVIIYSSNVDSPQNYHIKQRKFTNYLELHHPDWMLLKKIDNPFEYSQSNKDNTSFADFYVYGKRG